MYTSDITSAYHAKFSEMWDILFWKMEVNDQGLQTHAVRQGYFN
jgi:hypothetical protein